MNLEHINRKRYYWIDWVKCIAITLMVWAHISPLFCNLIFLFHMPLFFMVSGYLYRRRDVKDDAKSVLFSLLLPYLLYNFIYLLPLPLGGGYQPGYISYILLGDQEQLCFLMRPMWFLVVLMMMRLVCSIHLDMKVLMVICIIITALLYGKTWGLEDDYFQWRTTILCLPFWAGGYYLRQLDVMPFLKRQNKKIIVAFGIILFAAIMFFARNKDFNVFRCRIGDNLLSFYFITFSLSTIIMALCQMLLDRYSVIIERLSRGTLLILATHLIIFWQIPQLPIPDIFNQLIGLIVVLLTSYFLIYLSEMFCPVLIGKWTWKK